MASAAQIRAARALLALSQSELATAAHVGLATLQRIEAEGATPRGTVRTRILIRSALEAMGIVFIEETDQLGAGVRFARPTARDASAVQPG